MALLLILGGAAATVALIAWAWKRIPVTQCPRCSSYNTADYESEVGPHITCIDCGCEWGAFD